MKIDRLLGILTILLQKERTTAPELAARFEVNRRTIGRDIDALCQAGIPIITQQGAGGGISIAEGFKLDKNILTTNELSEIIAALKGIGSISEQSQIERTLDKFNAGSEAIVSLSEPMIIDLASYYKEDLTEKIKLIKQAIHKQQTIQFDYFSEKGESHRHIEPYHIIFQWAAWYVIGFCLEKQDWRVFSLMRLQHLALSDINYVPREMPPEKRNFHERFADDIKLVALFDPSEKYRLIETWGMSSFTETNEGLLLEIGFTNAGYITQWLLGFGEKVKVIEPIDIAQVIQLTAKNILKNYNNI